MSEVRSTSCRDSERRQSVATSRFRPVAVIQDDKAERPEFMPEQSLFPHTDNYVSKSAQVFLVTYPAKRSIEDCLRCVCFLRWIYDSAVRGARYPHVILNSELKSLSGI